jgi:hypothetical protein
MLSDVKTVFCYANLYFAVCCYAESRYDVSCYADFYYSELYYDRCHCADKHCTPFCCAECTKSEASYAVFLLLRSFFIVVMLNVITKCHYAEWHGCVYHYV